MCFYPFAKGELFIQRCSETIVFEAYGKTKVIVDCQIRNVSEEHLGNINFLYPNSFIHCYKSAACTKPTGWFENLSDELLLPIFNEKNSLYASAGYTLEISDDEEIDGKKIPVRVFAPPPSSYKDMEVDRPNYQGYILSTSSNDLKVYDSQVDNETFHLEQSILQDTRFTIFSLKLEHKLPPGKSILLRLSFGPDKNSTYNYPLRKELMLLAINELYHNYMISGPIDIKERYLERMTLILKYLPENSTWMSIKENFRKRYIEIVEQTNTNYENWQIHLVPWRLRTLFNFYAKGEICPQGAFPNFLVAAGMSQNRFVHQWRYRTYGWKAVNSCKFDLYFSGKTHNRFAEASVILLSMTLVLLYLQYTCELAEELTLALAVACLGHIIIYLWNYLPSAFRAIRHFTAIKFYADMAWIHVKNWFSLRFKSP